MENNNQKTDDNFKEIHHHYHNEKKNRVNFGKLFLGILLILAGFLYLVNSMGWLDLNFNFNLLNLWPLVIIFFGLSMFSARRFLPVFFGIIFTLVVLGIVLTILFFGNMVSFSGQENYFEQDIFIAKEANIASASIDVSFGAGEMKIAGNSEALISGVHKSKFIEMATSSELENNIQKATIKGTSLKKFSFKSGENISDFKVNSEIPLSISIDSGASKMDLDFSEVMAEKININTGASSLDIVLGEKMNLTLLNIDAGASAINIVIPKNLGVKMNIDSGLSSKNFSEFEKIDSKNYQSENYGTSTKKAEINLNLGVSSLNIVWK